MTPDLQRLRDIHDPLGNPWWPLAPGWWLVLLALCALAVLLWRQRRQRPLLPPLPLLRIGDWRWDAQRQLKRLQQAGPTAPLKTQAAELAELLKRIAMARHGRAHCAGLHGQAWLAWLTEQDPAGFDWRQEGQILIRVPYAPEHPHGHPNDRGRSATEQTRNGANAAISQADQQQLARLLAATERWIVVRPRTGRTRGLRWPALRGKTPPSGKAAAVGAEARAKAAAEQVGTKPGRSAGTGPGTGAGTGAGAPTDAPEASR